MRAVFLDRDGVINDNSKIRNVNKIEELILFSDAAQAIRRLNDAGFFVAVVTNQGGVGLGYMTEGALNEIHDEMVRQLQEQGAKLDVVRACIHAPKAGCSCRKPRPGMILELAQEHQLNLADSYMVGDRETDVEAGHAAGVRTVFIGRGPSSANTVVRTLSEAVDWILLNS